MILIIFGNESHPASYELQILEDGAVFTKERGTFQFSGDKIMISYSKACDEFVSPTGVVRLGSL